MPLDAISTPTLSDLKNDEIPREASFWAINGRDSDASTAIEIKATPGAGKSLYILSVLITSDDADAHPHLQDGDATILFGPFYSTVEGIVIDKEFKRPIKMVENKALQIKAEAAGNVSIYVEGYTANS